MELNKIYNMDCLEGLKQIPDNSIDLVVTDPPYNIKKAEWDTWKTVKEYVEWLGSVFVECQRVLKDNGSLYFFHNDFMQIVEIQNYINKNTDFKFNSFIIWHKDNFRTLTWKNPTEENNLRSWFNVCEYCLYYNFQDETGLEIITDKYIKSKNPFSIYLREEFKKAKVTNKEISKLFPSKTGGLTGCVSNWLNGDNIITKEQYLKIKSYLNNEHLIKEYEELRQEYENQRYTHNLDNNHNNVWKSYDKNNNCEIHPTQKPLDIIERIIKTSSNKTQVVLDPFMGSGTTAIACMNLQREFIGFEKDDTYYKLATNRILNHFPQTNIFDFI